MRSESYGVLSATEAEATIVVSAVKLLSQFVKNLIQQIVHSETGWVPLD